MNTALFLRPVAVTGILLLGATHAQAATLTVTTLRDAGPGSLRAAITRANRAPSSDVIVFAPRLRGTLGLKSALPHLISAITIQGPGRDRLNVRRIGKAPYRIFTITRSGNVSLSGLTISNGFVVSPEPDGSGKIDESNITHGVGGGICNEGYLQVNDCTITGNQADDSGGGVYNNGPQISLTNCLVTRNKCLIRYSEYIYGGGGLLSNSGDSNSLTLISYCTFSGNLCTSIPGSYAPAYGSGGAIAIGESGTLNVFRSTLNDNVASGGGGAINAGSEYGGTVIVRESAIFNNRALEGGGLSNGQYGGHISLMNSTLSGNRATERAGAIDAGTGGVTLNSCTIVNNVSPKAAGVWSCIDSELSNNIIAGNLLPSHAPGTDIELWRFAKGQKADSSQGSNLIGRGDALTLSCFHAQGDRRNVSAAGLKLGALADNGGLTKTHALLPGSPAIGKGGGSDFTDQRGVIRSSSTDVGAYQSTPPTRSAPKKSR